MNGDPHHQFRVRIDNLTDELAEALEREQRQRRRAERWHKRAQALLQSRDMWRNRWQKR